MPDLIHSQPAWFIPHGGGPCFFMDWSMGPADTWDRMAVWLRGLAATLVVKPKAIVVISGHWEEKVFAVTGGASPPLLYDYDGFPEHTYQLTYPAPGAPALADKIVKLLIVAGLPARLDCERGFDHGVFVPFKLIFPAADIPVLQISLQQNLDPDLHLQLGRALASLRQEDVLIVGSGMSYHNMRRFGQSQATGDSVLFDHWLTLTVEQQDLAQRTRDLQNWAQAPAAMSAHPRAEHFIPLLVAAGSATAETGHRIFTDQVMCVQVSAFQFGAVTQA